MVIDEASLISAYERSPSLIIDQNSEVEMVELKLECWDLAHRKGYLIHRGKYFFFQPLCLNLLNWSA